VSVPPDILHSRVSVWCLYLLIYYTLVHKFNILYLLKHRNKWTRVILNCEELITAWCSSLICFFPLKLKFNEILFHVSCVWFLISKSYLLPKTKAGCGALYWYFLIVFSFLSKFSWVANLTLYIATYILYSQKHTSTISTVLLPRF